MAARRMRPGTALEKYPTAPMHRGKYFSVQNRVQKIPKMPLPWKKGLVSKISGVKTFSERALCPHLPASSSWQLGLGIHRYRSQEIQREAQLLTKYRSRTPDSAAVISQGYFQVFSCFVKRKLTVC